MNGLKFDGLIKTLGVAGSRRSLVATLVTGAVATFALGPGSAAKTAKRDGRDRGRDRRTTSREQRRKHQRAHSEAICFSGSPCSVGPSAYLVKCDLSDSSALKNANCQSCNLSGAQLTRVDASGANLKSANLSKACVVEADFSSANLSGVNLSGAIVCRTKMPDGTINNSGCNKSNRCCQVCRSLGETGCGVDSPCCGDNVCREGTCACPDGSSNCGGTCIDSQTDPANCGGCGNRCMLNAICNAGRCECVFGYCGDPYNHCPPPECGEFCVCGGLALYDPSQCGYSEDCPIERQCRGPVCNACCPTGTECDPGTGTCLPL